MLQVAHKGGPHALPPEPRGVRHGQPVAAAGRHVHKVLLLQAGPGPGGQVDGGGGGGGAGTGRQHPVPLQPGGRGLQPGRQAAAGLQAAAEQQEQ